MDGFDALIVSLIALAAIVIALVCAGSARERIAALERRVRLLEAENSLQREPVAHWQPATQRTDAFDQHASASFNPGAIPVVRQTTMAAGADAVNPQPAKVTAPVEPWGSPIGQAGFAATAQAAAVHVSSGQPINAPGGVATKSRPQPGAPADSLPASLFRIVAKNPLASAGVLLLLVGVGFLFALLAARNILPPMVRIGLIATGGALLFATGLRIETKNSAVSFNLQGGAIAVEFLCGLWAYTGYHLLNSTEAFFVLGAISTLAYLWAAFKKGLAFAFIGLIGALATPVVTSTGHGEFSSLVLYCLWIASLTICSAGYLRSASLAPAGLVGISVLLDVALGGNHGDARFIVAGCSTIALAFTIAGSVWARNEPPATDRLRASVVTLLLIPSLVMASLIAAATNIELSDSALLAGAIGILLLAGSWFKSQLWRAWFILIGSMLTFVAITLHMHGAGQSVVMSAGALGLFMVAHFLKTPALRIAATLYWLVSSVVALEAISNGYTLAIYTCAAVALLAAYMERVSLTSVVFLMAAPLLAGAGVMHTFDGSAAHILIFMLAWTLVAMAGSGMLDWPRLRYSALWLLPAGAALMISPEWTASTALWALREGAFAGWLVLSTWLVRAVYRDTPEANSSSYLWASQLIAACVSIEVLQLCGPLGFAHKESVYAALALVWAISAAVVARLYQSQQPSAVTSAAAAVALLFAMTSVVMTRFGAIDEMMMVASIALVVVLYRQGRVTSTFLNATLLISVGLLAVAGAILQFVAARDGLDQIVLMLLFDERMQSTVSILWAAFGLVIVASGSSRKARDVWIVGAVTVAALVVKMFIVDLASLSLPTRVGTFMLIGVLFIALGYFCPVPAGRSRDVDALPVEP